MRLPLAIGTLLLVGAMSSCGAPGSPEQPSASPSGPAPTATTSPAPSPSQLAIVVDDGHGSTTTWRLTCDPPGGDHPDPTVACAVLATNGARALPPVAEDRACTQVYGGAQTAAVNGTWDDRPLSSRFSLVNGCEIDRWKALVGVLPPVGA